MDAGVSFWWVAREQPKNREKNFPCELQPGGLRALVKGTRRADKGGRRDSQRGNRLGEVQSMREFGVSGIGRDTRGDARKENQKMD